jgi:Mn-dependent DtxR family transcriptional regulator
MTNEMELILKALSEAAKKDDVSYDRIARELKVDRAVVSDVARRYQSYWMRS